MGLVGHVKLSLMRAIACVDLLKTVLYKPNSGPVTVARGAGEAMSVKQHQLSTCVEGKKISQ